MCFTICKFCITYCWQVCAGYFLATTLVFYTDIALQYQCPNCKTKKIIYCTLVKTFSSTYSRAKIVLFMYKLYSIGRNVPTVHIFKFNFVLSTAMQYPLLGLFFALKTYLLMRHTDKIYNVRLRLRIIVTNVWSGGFIQLDWEEAC